MGILPDAMTAAPMARAARFRDEFPVFRHARYLNSCSLGALSCRSRERVNQYLDLWEARGSSAWYDVWWEALAELRHRYGGVIGAAGRDMALMPNISTALTAVAESLDYRVRPRVVVTSLDFPTLPYQWLAKRSEGVEVVVVGVSHSSGTGMPALVLRIDRASVVVTVPVVSTSHRQRSQALSSRAPCSTKTALTTQR